MRKKAFTFGAIALALLGLIHLAAHFGMTPPDNAKPLMDAMQSYSIELFGSHSLLKFHNGFSVMMGLLILAFGTQSYLLRDSILRDKKVLIATFIFVFLAAVVAFWYFHALAYGFLTFTAICFGYALLTATNPSNPSSNG